MDALLNGLRAAAESTRLRLIVLGAKTELTVSELTAILGQSQPRVSRHLKLLCDAGLFERVPEGGKVFYRITQQGDGAELVRHLLSLVCLDDEVFALDRERLRSVQTIRANAADRYFSANAVEWSRIRALHVPESDVESTVLSVFDRPIEDFLDIGTGTGRLLELLAGRMKRGMGIDLNRDMLALARVNLDRAGLTNVRVRRADLYQLPFSAESFDAVMLHQVLHFLDDPEIALTEAARVLRPGGRMVLVDFLSHAHVELKTSFAHRRLGFSDEEIIAWCSRICLRVKSPIHLKGDPLTVALWIADAPGVSSHAASSLFAS